MEKKENKVSWLVLYGCGDYARRSPKVTPKNQQADGGSLSGIIGDATVEPRSKFIAQILTADDADNADKQNNRLPEVHPWHPRNLRLMSVRQHS